MLLHPLPQRKAIHLPSGVSRDVAGMERSASIKRPGEINASNCARLGDPVQAFLLLIFPIVRGGDDVHCDLILGPLAPDQHLDQFHYVAHLMILPDIGAVIMILAAPSVHGPKILSKLMPLRFSVKTTCPGFEQTRATDHLTGPSAAMMPLPA